MAKGKSKGTDEPANKELVAIKRLLMAIFLKLGGTQGELAVALGMDPADVSRMMPARKIKSAK